MEHGKKRHRKISFQDHTKGLLLIREQDPHPTILEREYGYPQFLRQLEVFGSTILIIFTVLNFSQVAYLFISTFTGAPWEELNLFFDCNSIGVYNFVSLFNIFVILLLYSAQNILLQKENNIKSSSNLG